MSIRKDFILEQGTDFEKTFSLHLGDVSADSANSLIRKHYTSTNSYSFNVELNANGEVILSMNSETSSSINDGRYVYDVEVTNETTNAVSRVLEGIVTVTPQVTR